MKYSAKEFIEAWRAYKLPVSTSVIGVRIECEDCALDFLVGPDDPMKETAAVLFNHMNKCGHAERLSLTLTFRKSDA